MSTLVNVWQCGSILTNVNAPCMLTNALSNSEVNGMFYVNFQLVEKGELDKTSINSLS